VNNQKNSDHGTFAAGSSCHQ